MIDARRDEVYAQVYLPEVGFSSTQALCLNKDTWVVHDTERSVFIGDACEKAQQLLQVNAVMCFDGPDAQQLAVLAHTKFARKEFESVAYFEPVYLKEFEPGISKKFIL
jgi:tRNA threonylcarbamoyladenosine biosynthesis protein TsaB